MDADDDGSVCTEEDLVVSETEFGNYIGNDTAFSYGIFKRLINGEMDLVRGGKEIVVQLLQIITSNTRAYNALVNVSDGHNNVSLQLKTLSSGSFAPMNSIVGLSGITYDAPRHVWIASTMRSIMSSNEFDLPLLNGQLPELAPNKKRSAAEASSTDGIAEKLPPLFSADDPEDKKRLAISPKRQNTQTVMLNPPRVCGEEGSSVRSQMQQLVLRNAATATAAAAGIVLSPVQQQSGEINMDLDPRAFIGTDFAYFSRLSRELSFKGIMEKLAGFYIGPVRLSAVIMRKVGNQPFKLIMEDIDGNKMTYISFTCTEEEVCANFEEGCFYFLGNGSPKFSKYSNKTEINFSLSGGGQVQLIHRRVLLSQEKAIREEFDRRAGQSVVKPASEIMTVSQLNVFTLNSDGRTGTQSDITVQGVLKEVTASLQSKNGSEYFIITLAEQASVTVKLSVWSSCTALTSVLKQRYGGMAYSATVADLSVVQVSGITVNFSSQYKLNLGDNSKIAYMKGHEASIPDGVIEPDAPLMTLRQAMNQVQGVYFNILVFVLACSGQYVHTGPNKTVVSYYVNLFDDSCNDDMPCVRVKWYKGNPMVDVVRRSGEHTPPVLATEVTEGNVVCKTPETAVVMLLRNYTIFTPEGQGGRSGNFASVQRRYLIRGERGAELQLLQGDSRATALVAWYKDNGYTYFMPDLTPPVRATDEYDRAHGDMMMNGGGNAATMTSSSSLSSVPLNAGDLCITHEAEKSRASEVRKTSDLMKQMRERKKKQ